MTKFLANGLANNAHNVYSKKKSAALIMKPIGSSSAEGTGTTNRLFESRFL